MRLFAPLAVLACLLFIRREFGQVTFEQFLFHVHPGVRGAITADPVPVRRFFLYLGIALLPAMGLASPGGGDAPAVLRRPGYGLRAWLTGRRYALLPAAVLLRAAW